VHCLQISDLIVQALETGRNSRLAEFGIYMWTCPLQMWSVANLENTWCDGHIHWLEYPFELEVKDQGQMILVLDSLMIEII
jgi:hypothetical protein